MPRKRNIKLINKIQFVKLDYFSKDNLYLSEVRSGQLAVGIIYYDDIVIRVILDNAISEVRHLIKEEYGSLIKGKTAPNDIEKQIAGYLRGEVTSLECKTAIKNDGFSGKVIKACSKVPYGETLTYGELAGKAGNAKAARAAGSAMKNNSLPLLVPCHRVIRADGTPGEYSAANGTETKVALLGMEKGAMECC